MNFIRMLCKLKPQTVLLFLVTLTIISGACSVPAAPSQLTEQQNSPPVIHYMTAHNLTVQKQVTPSSGITVRCVATDDDGDRLSYKWSSTGGEIQIKGEAEDILWIAPDGTGDYTITVEVKDGRGGTATGSIIILVTNEPPRHPLISRVTCIGCKNGIEASRWKSYEIRCDASDPKGGELRYTWFASMGKVSGNGPIITWQTMGQYGNALITVIVTDEEGNKAEGYLAINIDCCH
ncbi:MAG: hypothetical protein FJ005_04580 [Chloroflexi bacterium]|nr:hypothetical protein [Chloroflexota bacterium]